MLSVKQRAQSNTINNSGEDNVNKFFDKKYIKYD